MEHTKFVCQKPGQISTCWGPSYVKLECWRW